MILSCPLPPFFWGGILRKDMDMQQCRWLCLLTHLSNQKTTHERSQSCESFWHCLTGALLLDISCLRWFVTWPSNRRMASATCQVCISISPRHIWRGLVNITLRNFSDTIPEPVEYDPDYPDFNVEISKKLKEFDTTHLLDAEVALPFAQKLRSKLEVLARERRRINDEFGNSTANWRDVLRRGCDLLASRKIGGRFVVERKQDLSPFLTAPEIIRLDNPECLGLVPLDSFCQEFSQKLRYRSVFEIVCLVSFELHP